MCVCVYVCVEVESGWGGVAGQLEHSFVKKSIKKKQRRKIGKRLFLPTTVLACKAQIRLSEQVQELFIGKARISEGKEVSAQDYDFLFCGIQHQIQSLQFTISHLLSNLPQSS